MKTNHQNWLSKHGNQLELSWGKREFIELTIQQINKDINPYHSPLFEEEFESGFDLKNHLIIRIKDALQTIDRNNPAAIPQLMYAIDIPENIFQEILSESSSYYFQLAEVILIREAYKVWIRMNFS